MTLFSGDIGKKTGVTGPVPVTPITWMLFYSACLSMTIRVFTMLEKRLPKPSDSTMK